MTAADDLEELESNWQWYFLPVMCLTIAAFIYVWKEKPRKSFEVLLINLFLQNFFFLLSTIYSFFNISQPIFDIFVGLNKCLFYLQMFTYVQLTLSRGIAVYYPIKSKLWITKKRTTLVIVLQYTVVFSIRGIAVSILKRSNRRTMYLVLLWTGGLAFAFSVLVLLFTSSCIVYKLRRRHNITNLPSHIQRGNSADRKTTKLLIWISLSFTITYLSPVITSYTTYLDKNHPVKVFMPHLLWIDSLVNAGSYLVLKTKFVKHVKTIPVWSFKNRQN